MGASTADMMTVQGKTIQALKKTNFAAFYYKNVCTNWMILLLNLKMKIINGKIMHKTKEYYNI